ncbi:hypothetical protein U0C82_03835 [Fulvimarina sp. 2208YS6-2-32]|uniref:GcrA cell cycle regulator n=1 Tax=Fulvimarina uroteuthidis TaxID=3098149 RepID=A0ABU5HZR5_9HYPH|nr:hypothetical protein [Fulvimarina sp. 2208YS6-2-32]MDY8108280.1 hypothetical protein [Fulvimarina sp. 2208YS6-2-32]
MTKDQKATASAMWRAGRSSFEIADALDVDRVNIIRMSIRNRDLFPKRTSEERRAIISRSMRAS